MRVLLTSHLPLRRGIAGARLAWLREQLSSAHEIRVVQCGPSRDVPDDVRVVVCSSKDPTADLPFDVPVMKWELTASPSFNALSNAQLAAYREAFRAAIDTEIEHFNPQVVHIQHLWIDGHLVLESGAPYVVSAYAGELATADADARFLRYVQETAENAGKILVADAAIRNQLANRFDLHPDRFIAQQLPIDELTKHYQAVHNARFGSR